MDRTILHCDLNGFYASVECIGRPELRAVPMAVGGDPESRHGIILAKNELAKRQGVVTAETIWQARRKCPELVVVPPHHDRYAEYSEKVNAVYQRYTDLVEPFGIDESWLDITGSMHLFGGDARRIADEIRAVVRRELELTLSVGVSFTKTFAKLGSDYKKPDATTVIGREDVERILYPLPVGALLYVGRSAQNTLARMGIRTIGQLARCDRAVLSRALGKAGEQLWDSANGANDSPVRSAYAEREVKSVGNGMTFHHNLTGEQELRPALSSLCDSVGARLRRHGVKCQTVQLQIRDPDFKTISRQKTLKTPTFLSRELMQVSWEILCESWSLTSPVRMMAVTGANLLPAGEVQPQLSLFEEEDDARRQKREKLELAMDDIRKKHGRRSIGPGSILEPVETVGLPDEKLPE